MDQDNHFQQPQRKESWLQEDYDALGQAALSKFAFYKNGSAIIRREAHEYSISLIHDVAGEVLRACKDEAYFSLIPAKQVGEVMIVCTPLANRIVSALSADFLQIRLDYPLHRFSPVFKVFSSVRRRLLSIGVGSYLKLSWPKDVADKIIEAAMVVIKVLRKRLSKAAVKEAYENFRRGAIENFNGLVDAIDWLSQRCSTVTVLRFDLHFRESGSQPVQLGDVPNAALLHEFQNYRGRFHRFLDRHFRDALRGYAWVMEYGRERLFHVHYLVMLDPRGREDHCALVEHLEEKWKQITAGQGTCYNCNEKVRAYRYLATGVVRLDDPDVVTGLQFIVSYMTLAGLFVKLDVGVDIKTFGKGRFPRSPAPIVGRPRKQRSRIKITVAQARASRMKFI